MTTDPICQVARAALRGHAPVGVAAWARHVLAHAGGSPAPEQHALVGRDGRVAGWIAGPAVPPAFGPGAPTVLLRRAEMSVRVAPRRSGETVRPAVLAVLLAAAVAGVRPAAAQVPAGQANAQLRAFERAWTVVYETHFDTTFNGVDWVALRDELRPRAASATTNAETRAVINEMLSRLGQSHFAVFPREVVDRDIGGAEPPEDENEPGGAGDSSGVDDDTPGDLGLDVHLIGSRVIVTAVEPGGPAAAAGIRPGWVLASVGGRSIDSLVERLREVDSRTSLRFLTWMAVLRRVNGPPGSAARLGLVTGTDDSVAVTVRRRREPSAPVQFGNLPPFYSRFRGRRDSVPGGGLAAVVWFNFWMVPLIRQVDSALFASRALDGIVIDLRGNRGGVGAMVLGVAGHFFTERESLGVFRTRTTTLTMRANPRRVTPAGRRAEPYAGPVAILVDETSGSASEMFAGGMQAAGRARVFGDTTAGAVLPATTERLPNDDVLYHAFAEFTTATGVRLEGRGVIPDDVVVPTRRDLLEEHDPALDAALRWIGQRARHDRTNGSGGGR